MNMLYTVLLADFSMVLVYYAILLLALTSDVVLSSYHNINITGEHFDAERLWQGVKKALVLVFGTMLVVATVDVATTLLTQYVPDINEQVHDLIIVAMIATTIGVAAWCYIKDAYSTFINILNGKPSEVAAAVDAKEQCMELLQFIKDHWVILYFLMPLSSYLTIQIMALRNGIKALLHDRIIQKCECHIRNNRISADDLEELEYLNRPYKVLGGSGAVEVMLRTVYKLPKQVQEEN